ncbi:endoplasmic reticulum metallopeptidase 1-like isoform X5 [Vanessa atalanta]|uniref:endoplasmic reticulum metallopeptidase 1-like isoform X5 n=1 Tax=Vanessa atalanta TaxID=42275 RepID=UPI001FCCC6AA|nr:endoplasmic reticulum metallopeptidase 1-like isoform X5 [Vanessa atalanta]
MSSKNRQTFAGLPTIEANDHDEKSSQRVPGPYILLFFGFYLLLTYTIIVIEDAMPTVIRERDIANDDSNTFSEETAKVYLNRILGGQPRVAGTLFHLIKTRDMKDIVDEIANKANIPVRTDWQFVSGDYWLASSSSHVNCYQNVSNVIAVLEGESGFHPNGTIGTSLLVNCHYDSVPFAIGASDNGVFCAVMAETLSKLSRRKEKLKHNIIFLFNGAEESALMGSHGFLSHPWAKGVTNVVNLDSAGMNGKPSVFQVTDPRVLKAYKRTCSKPNAQGLGEVLFASGVIPSDTDFRIFRDFGNIHGIDIAFIKGGNVYHTRNDRPELIQDGVIQNAGNMLLSLVRELADSEELENKESKSTVVYYDYMGLFMVTYSRTTGLVVDILIGLLGLSSVVYFLWLFGLRRSSVIELLWSVLGRIVCVLFGLAVVALNTVVMVATTTQMRYLSEQWLVVPLYIGPFVIAMTVASHAFDSWRARKREPLVARVARAGGVPRGAGGRAAAAVRVPAAHQRAVRGRRAAAAHGARRVRVADGRRLPEVGGLAALDAGGGPAAAGDLAVRVAGGPPAVAAGAHHGPLGLRRPRLHGGGRHRGARLAGRGHCLGSGAAVRRARVCVAAVCEFAECVCGVRSAQSVPRVHHAETFLVSLTNNNVRREPNGQRDRDGRPGQQTRRALRAGGAAGPQGERPVRSRRGGRFSDHRQRFDRVFGG